MQVQKTAASFALIVLFASAVPSFAAADRDRGRDPKEGIGPIERVIQIIKRIIVKPLEEISIPHP
jgi:hypothetical protein